jgi:hypothetical protein
MYTRKEIDPPHKIVLVMKKNLKYYSLDIKQQLINY